MTEIILTAAAFVIGAIIIALAILAPSARKRFEQRRDQDADRLRDACNTFHRGSDQ